MKVFNPLRSLAAAGALLLSTATLLLATATRAPAAQRIVITYGPLGRSLPISDFQQLAETGTVSSDLAAYLRLANLKPEALRQVLTEQVEVRLRLADRITYSLPGEFLLYKIGQTVHTHSRKANIQALRAALLLSLSRDNQISLLEFLQNYPTPEIYIDGVSLVHFIGDVQEVADRVRPAIAVVQDLLESLVCDCGANLQNSEPAQLNQSSPR